MTIHRDEILRMAREAGVNTEPDIMVVMERFAALVAAAENKACAEIAADSDHIVEVRGYYAQLGDAAATARNIEEAIRDRGAAAIGEKVK